MDKKIVIGLVGEKGGGKGTFTSLLQELLPNIKIEKFKSSDPLFETLALWNLPATRENLTNLSISMRQTFGEGSLTAVVMQRIHQSEAQIAIFDGIRWNADVQAVKQEPENLLVYVTADQKIRYERTRGRKEKDGEENATFEQFQAEEQTQTETLIPQIGSQADFKITNNGTLGEFKAQVKSFVNKYLSSVISNEVRDLSPAARDDKVF